MSIHKARNNLANQKRIQISLQSCGTPEQAFGSRYADGLYRGCRMSTTQARKGPGGEINLLRNNDRFELSRVLVNEGKIQEESVLVRVNASFELRRVRVNRKGQRYMK